MYLLGISAYYHDSAAALIKGEEIVAAAQEERFTRKKHDSGFPENAVRYCLSEGGVGLGDISYIAFYDKPLLKFERILETYVSEAPKGFRSFTTAMPVWLKEKLFLKNTLVKELVNIQSVNKKDLTKKIKFAEHHQSHAASAFYPSPYNESAIITIDGVGEWSTTALSYGRGNDITFLKEINFPHSLGLLYSAFTYYTGFKVNSGEYKVMGLAPYGEPKYVQTIKDNLIDIKEDGSFRLNMKYFNYTSGLTMTNDNFHELFGGLPRTKEALLTQREMDIARSIQEVTDEVVSKITKFAKGTTGSKNLCMAGGVALNCVSNGKILREGIFENIWIQPAAGDAGGALGAAYSVYYQESEHDRKPCKTDMMHGGYLGPAYSNEDVKKYLDESGAAYHLYSSEEELLEDISKELMDGKVIGWHHDRMEFGPRALGNRSIIGDARNPKMQSKMNLKIKFRESFRPFAPSVLKERVNDYFDLNTDSPYMLLVAPVKDEIRIPTGEDHNRKFGIEKLNVPRSAIPAVTHVDYSARIHTVDRGTNPRYYGLIKKFSEKTGCPVIVNTSFNVRGEPIVCTPKESYACFMRTEMDILVIEDFVLYKEEQPKTVISESWKEEFELD